MGKDRRIEEPRYPVTTVVRAGELDLYRAAAAMTGFSVHIVAKPGETFQLNNLNSGVTYTETVKEGSLRVQIEAPETEKDHGAFWKALKGLTTAQQPPQKP